MNPDEHSWGPCPEGELDALAGRLRQQRRNFVVNRVAAGGAAVLLALVVVGVAAPFVRDHWFVTPAAAAPISCREVRGLLPQYARHKLDPELTRRIDKHLEHCGQCRDQLSHTTAASAAAASPDEATVQVAAALPSG